MRVKPGSLTIRETHGGGHTLRNAERTSRDLGEGHRRNLLVVALLELGNALQGGSEEKRGCGAQPWLPQALLQPITSWIVPKL